MNKLYTPSEAAADIIGERANDVALNTRLMEYIGDELPDGFPDAGVPVAYTAPYVAGGTVWERDFAERARAAGFEPWIATYGADKYVDSNGTKVAALRPTLLLPKGQQTKQWVVAPADRQGSIGALPTIYEDIDTPGRQDTVSDYQAGLRAIVFDEAGLDGAANIFDMSRWYVVQARRFGYEIGPNLAPAYYNAIMALIAVKAALYDQVYTDGKPTRFTVNVMSPAFDNAYKALGERPVIVEQKGLGNMNITDLRFLDTKEIEVLKTIGSRALSVRRQNESGQL